MKRKLFVGMVSVGLLACAFTAAYATTTNEKEAQRVKHEKAVKAHFNDVQADLKKDAHVDSSYLTFNLNTIKDITANPNWDTAVSQKLGQSVSKEIEHHGVLNYFIPSIFVKHDASEYVLGFKNAQGENEILRYKLQDGGYIKIDTQTTKGVKFDTVVNTDN